MFSFICKRSNSTDSTLVTTPAPDYNPKGFCPADWWEYRNFCMKVMGTNETERCFILLFFLFCFFTLSNWKMKAINITVLMISKTLYEKLIAWPPRMNWRKMYYVHNVIVFQIITKNNIKRCAVLLGNYHFSECRWGLVSGANLATTAFWQIAVAAEVEESRWQRRVSFDQFTFQITQVVLTFHKQSRKPLHRLTDWNFQHELYHGLAGWTGQMQEMIAWAEVEIFFPYQMHSSKHFLR